MNIDWSKAPEDATYYSPGTDDYSSCWVKWVGSELHGWLVRFDTSWSRLVAQEKDHHQISMHVERPKKQEAWNGSGKPPIGIECEVRCNDVWNICKTLAYHQVSDTAVAVHFLDGSNSLFWCGTFRPIKTAEQLAEEEKKQAIDDMQRIYEESMLDYSSRLGHASRPAIKALYEAGYRKQ